MSAERVRQGRAFAAPFVQRPVLQVPDETPAPCLHDHVTIYKLFEAAPLQDHSTCWAFCNQCAEWLLITDFANGRRDDRKLTPSEIAQFTEETTKRRYAEFLEDYQSGCL